MKKMIQFCVERHLLVNIFFVGILAIGVLAWRNIDKEEMPDFEGNAIRVSIPFAGAAAGDVEELITIPVERQLKSVLGIERIQSSSSVGSSSIRISMDSDLEDKAETISSIKDAVDKAKLPAEVRDDISYRQFKTSEKAILDIAVYLTEEESLNPELRSKLQSFVRELENQLTNLNAVSRVDRNGYVPQQVQIRVDHKKLREKYVPLGQVLSTLKKIHGVSPSGSLNDKFETKVSVVSEFTDSKAIENVVIRANTDGDLVRLKDVATVYAGFDKISNLTRIQGREAIVLNIRKAANADILTARDSVFELVDKLQDSSRERGLTILPMDDESFDVRNRISIVGSNGVIGFIFICLILMIFLDWRSGLWTASGIPFSLAFTIIIALFIGYSVNNVTLAAVIIVLGIVVDDAIIVSENVGRLRQKGLSPIEAATQGAYELIGPIAAAILTTCAAFMPLMFFEGRIGNFVKYIPILIITMLAASFLESLFVLPSHLTLGQNQKKSDHWFDKFEGVYASWLESVLKFRWFTVAAFVVLFVGTIFVYKTKMDFVLFPQEESKEVYIKVIAEEALTRIEMAAKIKEVEAVFLKDVGPSVVAVRTSIASSRRGGEARENQAFMRVELIPKDDREQDLSTLKKGWNEEFAKLSGYKELKFIEHRFGSSSGSAISIEVRENDDSKREKVVNLLKEKLAQVSGIANVEAEAPLKKPIYELKPDFDQITLAGVDPETLMSSTRAYLNGIIAYSFVEDDEEVDVVLSLEPDDKKNIDQVTDLMVDNKQGFLIPLNRLVNVEKTQKATSIARINHKRTTEVFADLVEGKKIAPIVIAEILERDVFPGILKSSPSTVLAFSGEIQETRESGSEFIYSIIIVLILIYTILVMLYDSLLLPFVVMLIIPFGFVGVVLAFYLHGKSLFGFMAVVGMIGMIGVVVNDSIIMMAKLESADLAKGGQKLLAACSATRLRAIVVTTVTTVAGLLPTAYGIVGFDAMLSEMMLAMGWGLAFGTLITLILTPCLYSIVRRVG